MSDDKQSPGRKTPSQAELDNHSNQLNRNNDEYWKSRGEKGRPENWETLVPESKPSPKREE